MSLSKRLLEEQLERGWLLVGEKFVCPICVDDDYVRSFIVERASRDTCDYCGQASKDGSPVAAPVDDLFELIADGIRYEWTDPAEEDPWDEGEYVFPPYSSDDLLFELQIPLLSDSLIDEFCSSFSDLHWVQRHLFSLREDEALSYGWTDFAKHVTQQVRFLFRDAPGQQYGDIPVSDVLDSIGFVVNKVGLVRDLPAGTEVTRVRAHSPAERPSTASELGPPPHAKATQNRMSAAGISLFYGAHDASTAIAETIDDVDKTTYSVATFATEVDLRVLDLVEIPEPGSYWDPDARPLRRALQFLRSFAAAISEPIARDGREHVEYVPTQILTEYFHHVFADGFTDSDLRIHGIRYRSSRRDGGVCLVLFAGHRESEGVPPGEHGTFDQWLGLERVQARIAPATNG